MVGSTGSDPATRPQDRRKLIAVLYADMVGYSRLIELDDTGTLQRLRRLRKEVIDPAIEEHGGHVVQTGGDSLLIVFDSVDGAVQCAIQVQCEAPDFDSESSPDRAMRFRIGINIGDAIADGTDLHGDAVNVAARIQAECPPGGICVTRAVRDHVRHRLDLAFEDLGSLRLKNIAWPIHVFRVRRDTEPGRRRLSLPRINRHLVIGGLATIVVAGAGAWFWHMHASRDAPPLLSAVVLPFKNLSGDPNQEWFADQITDDLTTDLSRISGSVIIAHSTATTFRDKPSDVRQIGHDLDIRYVVEGSVRRATEQVAVDVRLIDASNGAQVWADRYDTDIHNLEETQDQITGRLARSLNLQFIEVAGRQIERQKDHDPLANDLVMRSWYLWFRPLSAATHDEAAKLFRQALELDPQSVEARVGTATILMSNIGTGLSGTPQQDSAQAERMIAEAIEQDPNNSRAYEVLGVLRRFQNRLNESRVAFETAIAIDRNNAHAMLQLGETLMFLGRPTDAIPVIEASIRLNPRDPNAAFGDWALGACHLLLGRTDQAVDLLRRARDGNPRVYYFHIYLAGALGLRGDIAAARAELEEVRHLKPAAGSLAGWQALQPWIGNPGFTALRAKTLDVGLRQAGVQA
jgi:TolB-like protein/class 3 adenylate cyclase/Tfp pilus assembly protein PilF